MTQPSPLNPPGEPSPPLPASDKPRPHFGAEFAIGFFAVPAVGILGIVLAQIPFAFVLVGPAFLGVFVFGLVRGLQNKGWGLLLGSVTCVLVTVLTLFAVCLVNPPRF